MEDQTLDCPLCCNMKFSSKQLLVEHLSNRTSNLLCPICKLHFTSLDLLIDHIRLDNCDNTHQTIFEEAIKDVTNSDFNQLDYEGARDIVHHLPNTLSDNTGSEMGQTISLSTLSEGSETNKLYVEIINKNSTNSTLQKAEVKLFEEDGKNKYFVFTDDSLLLTDKINSNTVVTKNNDGTISLTTIKDSEENVKKEAQISETPPVSEEDTEENKEEMYFCNTCGVSFISVLDHIQNYHNDQEVVVEESVCETSTANSMEYDPVVLVDNKEDETVVAKEATAKIITESGNIVHVPIEQAIVTESNEPKLQPIKREPRFLQIDKLCNTLVKGISKDNTVKEGPYHKVILKEMTTQTGAKLQVYNCMVCNVYVTALSEFQNRPCKTLKYLCPQCPVAYENSKSLCAHMKVHKSKAPPENFSVKFECEICSTIFPTSKSLKLHKRMHDPVKSRPIIPPMETKDGSVASNDKFLCSVCHKLIPIDYRVIHQNSHKANNNMICDICNKKFHSREYLEMHMSVHNFDKAPPGKQDISLPYKCLYCNRKFARPHEKVKHERVHTGEKPHSCEICGKSFRVAYCLTLHMRTHTGARPYACPHCNKRFKAHSVYNHHLLTHSEVRAYKCPFCPKAFKTSVQLAGHKNSHTKPFSCQQCNRPFASLYAVRVHMEVHARQNSLKFSCTSCGASYARAFALNDHIKQAHPAEGKGEREPLDVII